MLTPLSCGRNNVLAPILERPTQFDERLRSTIAFCRTAEGRCVAETSWRAIAKQLGVGVGTLYRVAPGRPKFGKRFLERSKRLFELVNPHRV